MGEGTDKRNRGAARGFRELTYRQSDDGASSINLLAFAIMLCALKEYQALQVTMLLVVNHLLVKAVDVIATDLT